MSAILSRLPPIHCLLAFEARARLNSGVLVAQELSITPSAVSHRIRQLEAFTGFKLFTKIKNNVVLSPEGQAYLETVRGALYALSYFSTQHVAEKLRVKLRVSSPPTFAARVLIPRLTKIRAEFPELDLDMQLSVPLVGTRAEPADIDFRFGDGQYPGRIVVKVLDEKVVAVCHPAYASQNGPYKKYTDIKQESLMRCSIEPWRPWFQVVGLDWSEPKSHYSFSDVGLFADAAAHEVGIALVRPTLAREYLDDGRLVILFPDVLATPYYAYYATCDPEAHRRHEVARFIEWLAADLYNPDSRYQLPR